MTKEYEAEYRRTHPDVVERNKEMSREYYWQHKDERLAYMREYQKAHKEELTAKKHQRDIKHKEERKAYNRRYYLEHRDAILAKRKEKNEKAI